MMSLATTMMTAMLALCPQGLLASVSHSSATGSRKWKSSSDTMAKGMSFQDRLHNIRTQVGAMLRCPSI